MRPRSLATALFALLVAATVAAFFVTQRLKSGQPVVKRLALQRYFSPNGDHRKDRARIAFDLPKADRVTVDVVNRNADRVRRLLDGRSLGRGAHALTWDGRADDGTVPPDGAYYVRVTLRRQGRAATGVRGIELVTEPPRPRLLSVTPSWLPAGRPGSVTIAFTGPSVVRPVYGIWRTDRNPPRRVATLAGDRQTHSIRWNGRIGGRPAPPGTYAVSVTVQNRALIDGSDPPRLRPARASARPRTGLTIGGVTAAGPLEPVRAGAVTSVDVYGAARARASWRLERAAGSSAVGRGRAALLTLPAHRPGPAGAPSATAGPRRRLTLRVPRRARTGLHVLTVAAGGRPARVPIVVRRAPPAPVLVVVPAIGWQGANALDDDADGFADTLFDSRSVPLGRPFAGGAVPPGLAAEVGPLLAFLDRSRLRYELTTDLALARGRGPRLAAHAGVALAGDEPWLTPGLAAELRGYAQAGGRVASFGAGSLRRRVSVTSLALAGATPPARVNALGEATAAATAAPPASLAASVDQLGLLAGTDGVVGDFTALEQSLQLPAGARALTAAGREPGRAALVAYRLGRGLVVRFGTPQWSDRLESDAEIATVTRNAWTLLSR